MLSSLSLARMLKHALSVSALALTLSLLGGLDGFAGTAAAQSACTPWSDFATRVAKKPGRWYVTGDLNGYYQFAEEIRNGCRELSVFINDENPENVGVSFDIYRQEDGTLGSVSQSFTVIYRPIEHEGSFYIVVEFWGRGRRARTTPVDSIILIHESDRTI